MSEPRTKFRCAVCGKARHQIDLRLDYAGAYRCKDTCYAAEREAATPPLDGAARKRLLQFVERMKAGLLIEEAVGYEDDQFVSDIEALLWDGIALARLAQQDGTEE